MSGPFDEFKALMGEPDLTMDEVRKRSKPVAPQSLSLQLLAACSLQTLTDMHDELLSHAKNESATQSEVLLMIRLGKEIARLQPLLKAVADVVGAAERLDVQPNDIYINFAALTEKLEALRAAVGEK